VYITRAWCLFELYTAILERRHVKVEVVITAEESASFLAAFAAEGHACIDSAFENIRSENATATMPADLDAIRKYVQSFPGGFEVLNQTCRKHLEAWFTEHGGVPSSAWTWRRSATARRSNSRGSRNSRDLTDDSEVPERRLLSSVEDENEVDDSITGSDRVIPEQQLLPSVEDSDGVDDSITGSDRVIPEQQLLPSVEHSDEV
jgi:hypothetical protein